MAEEDHDRPAFGRKVISIRAAMIAYAALLVIALATLRGYALGVALIVILGVAAKTYTHYLRERRE